MFNLNFSAHNNPFKEFGMIVSRNDWIINGKVMNVQKTNNGFWLRVKSSAKIAELFNFDKLEFDCFLPDEVAATAYKKDSYYKKLHAIGKFVLSKGCNYFVAHKMLV